MTRRETLVKFLYGDNGYTPVELDAALAVEGTTAFLAQAQANGLGNEDIADRLVAFKKGGGSGLASAIASIAAELGDNGDGDLEAIREDLEALLIRVSAALA